MIVKLRIESKREFQNLYWELRKAGFLGEVTVNDITLPERCFPLDIPIETDRILKMAKNPIVRCHKTKIDETLSKNVKTIKSRVI